MTPSFIINPYEAPSKCRLRQVDFGVISLSLSLCHRIDPIRLRHETIIVALEVSRVGGRDYQNMDSLGRSWLHYGVHAVSNHCRLGGPCCCS
jgi:hypothetical protein